MRRTKIVCTIGPSSREPERLKELMLAGLDVALILIGIGGTIFSYLFFRSGYVPKILAAWGILTYVTMFFISFVSILMPLEESIKMIFYAPGGLFELIFGFWLLIKSVNIPAEK